MIRLARSIVAQVAVFAVLASMFGTPLASADTVMTPEQIAPSSWVALDLQLSAKLKQQISPFLDQGLGAVGGDPIGNSLVEALKAGERILITGGLLDSLPYGLLAFPITDDQWEVLAAGDASEKYGDVDLYINPLAPFYGRLGNLMIGTNVSDVAKNAIDLFNKSKTNSLADNALYQKIAAQLLPGRFAGLYVNTAGLLEDLDKMGFPSTGGGLASLYEAFGISAAESADGYKFNIIVEGNEATMNQKGVSFAPGGSFVPSLYNKFPNLKPIFYAEGKNPKASWDQSEKLTGDILASIGEDAEAFDEIWKDMKRDTGIDIPAIYQTFEKEFGMALQYDTEKPYPYLTMLGNVTGNRAAGVKLAITLRAAITKALREMPGKAYDISTEGDITKITLDLTKTDDYDGPPFPIIEITVGVTDDDLFVLSNYPDIEQSNKRAGFGTDADFAASYQNRTEALTGLTYVNMRNMWKYADHMMEWAESVSDGTNAPPLDFYQGYYAALEQMYTWRDLMLTTKGAGTSGVIEGTLVFDNARHGTYEDLIEKLKSKDTDDNGVNDFDQRYVYKMSIDGGDRDNDGRNDFEEINHGYNPDGEGYLFDDVDEKDWYADEVGQTWNSGIVKGYEDDTFRPGNLVTRAEFVAMAVRAFEEDTSRYLGVSIELSRVKNNPFGDVSQDAWYLDAVSKAFAQGWIQGKIDPATYQRTFRPGDPITRAEAVQILTQASKALQQSQGIALAEPMPFKDVSEDAWFYGAVSNAYANDITQGKRPDEFQPLSNVTRAEAAALIFRTMNFEIQQGSDETDIGVGMADFAPFMRLPGPRGVSK